MVDSEFQKLRKQNTITTILGIFVSIVVAIISLVFGTGDSTVGIIILLGIFGFIAAFFLLSWPINLLIERFNKIDENCKIIRKFEKDLNNLKTTINDIKEVSELKAKVSLLEKFNSMKLDKKGFIDPRIIIIIIIIILVILLLRQGG